MESLAPHMLEEVVEEVSDHHTNECSIGLPSTLRMCQFLKCWKRALRLWRWSKNAQLCRSSSFFERFREQIEDVPVHNGRAEELVTRVMKDELQEPIV